MGTLTPDDNGTFLVGFTDFPEANSVGDDEADTMFHAIDARGRSRKLILTHTPQIDRLFDLNHSSKIEFVEQAAKALGKTLSVALI